MHHPPLNSLFDLIWSILLELFLVTQIAKYTELLIGNVQGSYGSLKTMKVLKFASYKIEYSKVLKFL